MSTLSLMDLENMSSSSEEDGTLVVKEEDLENDVELWDSHPRRSAFSPYRIAEDLESGGQGRDVYQQLMKNRNATRPVTVLTNLQRGNIQTQTTQVEPDEITIHTRAAMGEISPEDLVDIDIDEVDNNGFTPVMWASSYGQSPTVKVLVQHRANINIEGEDGETALLLAASNGHHDIVKLLIDCGGNVNHVDHMGNSALMYAAHGDHSHCGNELLEHGADITETNVAGSSAFSICVARGSKQIYSWLSTSSLQSPHVDLSLIMESSAGDGATSPEVT